MWAWFTVSEPETSWKYCQFKDRLLNVSWCGSHAEIVCIWCKSSSPPFTFNHITNETQRFSRFQKARGKEILWWSAGVEDIQIFGFQRSQTIKNSFRRFVEGQHSCRSLNPMYFLRRWSLETLLPFQAQISNQTVNTRRGDKNWSVKEKGEFVLENESRGSDRAVTLMSK